MARPLDGADISYLKYSELKQIPQALSVEQLTMERCVRRDVWLRVAHQSARSAPVNLSWIRSSQTGAGVRLLEPLLGGKAPREFAVTGIEQTNLLRLSRFLVS
ncbi:MAG TPA: hypothetical protein VJT13_27440 [Xanthobacteraceae bacterium]|nr:hypothetical protein [Xanthobacteraceae bacterium]